MSAITLFTTTGRALLAAAIANGQALASAKIAVGDGNGQVYVPNESQVALVHEVWRGAASVARTDDLVVFRATIPANVGNFIVRELGLYLGPVGAEQLFIVSQSPSREKIAAPANGGGPMEVSVHFSANAAQVAVLPVGSSGTAVLQLQNAPHITVDGVITAPPTELVDGKLYAIDAGATGIFTGQAGSLVERVAGAWVFRPMRNYSVIRDATNGAWLERSGADWVPFSFNDTSVAWSELTGVPQTFPPSAHTHPISQVTNLQSALDGKSDTGHTHPYLPLAGGALVGGLTGTTITTTGAHRANVGDSADAFVVGSSITGSIIASLAAINMGGGKYAMGILGNASGLDGTSGWRVVFDNKGFTGFGTVYPAEKIDIVGNIALSGAIKLASGFGAANQVPVSQTGGANTWANVIDLLSASDLRTKIGGVQLWAAYKNVYSGASIVSWTGPECAAYNAAAQVNGCTATIRNTSGSLYLDVTLTTSAGSTAYIVSASGIMSKTATSFTINLGAVGSDIATGLFFNVIK